MGKALGKYLKSSMTDKMEAFKSIYQKNRNEKKPVKMPFEKLSNYQQFFEVETVKTFTQKLNNKLKS
ncbi:MAG: hypothetical protein RSE50_00935 [Myroides sp.]